RRTASSPASTKIGQRRSSMKTAATSAGRGTFGPKRLAPKATPRCPTNMDPSFPQCSATAHDRHQFGSAEGGLGDGQAERLEAEISRLLQLLLHRRGLAGGEQLVLAVPVGHVEVAFHDADDLAAAECRLEHRLPAIFESVAGSLLHFLFHR